MPYKILEASLVDEKNDIISAKELIYQPVEGILYKSKADAEQRRVELCRSNKNKYYKIVGV